MDENSGAPVILVVDDDRSVLDVHVVCCGAMLPLAEIICVENGYAALDILLSGKRIDVVILDNQMPGPSGIQSYVSSPTFIC